MTSYRYITVLLFSVLWHIPAFAQDIHFSQFYASPITLNPGHTGDFQGDWRVMNNYRRQWNAIGMPFETLSIGGDVPLGFTNKRLAAGLILINDRSGDVRLHVNKVLLSVSFLQEIGKHKFRLGVQSGYVRKTYNLANLTFPDQYNGSSRTFDNTLSNNETGLSEQLQYVDFNAGLVWRTRMGKTTPFAGLSVFHLNRPNESFFGTENRLPMRTAFSGGATVPLSTRYFIEPQVFFMATNQASNLLLGSKIGYHLVPKEIGLHTIFVGVFGRDGLSRNTDAIVAVSGFSYGRLDIGLSYDITVSRLRTVTNFRGALEFSLIYRGVVPRLVKTAIPCERY